MGSGVSRMGLENYIKTNYPDREFKSTFLKQALKRGVADGSFLQYKGVGASGSFKLNKQAAKKNPAAAAKKKPAAKKKTTKKRAPAKKKPAKKGRAKKKPAK